MDIWDKSKRSEIMKAVKQKNTKPEILICKFLFSQGFRYRKNVKSLPGSPDIVLPKYKTVVFVHGCFWHGHSCRAGKRPSSNTDYWNSKIETNKNRDNNKEYLLKNLGWKVIIVWQCEVSSKEKKEKRLKNLIKEIRND